MDDAAHGNDYPLTPAPSPPSMIADPVNAALEDELSVICHHLRRNKDLRWRVLHLVKERIELQRTIDSLPMGTVDTQTGRVELPIQFASIGCDDIGCGYCECDE